MSLPQNNSALHKMSSRLGQAGSGSLSPILAGLKGRFTFTPDYENGENFHGMLVDPTGVVKCYNESMSTTTAKDWSAIIDFADTTTVDLQADVVFGDTTYMFTGATPTRNILEWTTNWGTCRRQFWVVNVPTSKGVYIDNQEAQSGRAKVFVDPTAGIDGGNAAASGETEWSSYWDKNMMFSLNILPEVGDEFFQQQEWFDPTFDVVSGNRYANTLRNWGGAKTVTVFLDAVVSPIIPETAIEDVDGYFWGPVEESELGDHTLTIVLRAEEGSLSAATLTAKISVQRFPC